MSATTTSPLSSRASRVLVWVFALVLGAGALTGCGKSGGSGEARLADDKAEANAPKDDDKADDDSKDDDSKDDDGAEKDDAKAEEKEAKKEKEDDGSVRFAQKGPSKGDKQDHVSGMSMDMNLIVKLGGKTVKEGKLSQKESKKKTTEVLEVKGEGADAVPAKVKVTYTTYTETKAEDGKPAKEEKAPVEGKTYTVESKDGKLTITDEQGNTPPAAELSIVRDDHDDMGEPDPMTHLIPDRPIKIGEKIDIPPEAFMGMMGDQGEDDVKLKDTSLTLKEVKEINGTKVGVFDLSMTMIAAPAPGMNMSIKLGGDVALGVDNSWPVKVALKGPIKFDDGQKGDAKGAGMSFGGGGDMTMTMENTYSK